MAEKALYQVSLKLILKRGDEILALKAREDGMFRGYYDMPGGRIHADEFGKELAGVLRREVQEELGDVRFSMRPEPVALGQHKSLDGIFVLYVFFVGEYESGEPKISHEHIGWDWLKLTDANLGQYFTSGILEGMRTSLSSR